MIKRQIFDNEDQWLLERDKVFTSSEVNRLMADVERSMTESEIEAYKKAEPKGRRKNIIDRSLLSDGAITYILEKIAASYGAREPIFFNSEMAWGKENEGAAVLELCNKLKLDTSSSDVIYTSSGGNVIWMSDKYGGTPDVDFPKLKANAEIKCPNTKTHLYYKAFVNAKNIQNKLPKYYDQMQLNMHLTNAEMCYFFSYDPRLSGNLESHTIEVIRDQARIDLILDKIEIAHAFKMNLIKKFNES